MMMCSTHDEMMNGMINVTLYIIIITYEMIDMQVSMMS